MTKVLDEVRQERERQDGKWGEPNHHPIDWLAILGEEVGEAFKAANQAGWGGKSTWQDYRAELVQVAAVAVAAIESLDRNGEPA